MSPDDAAETAAPIPDDVARMSFEEALAELEKIVRLLEEGGAKLEDAIAHYDRGAALKRHCESKLRDAQAKVDKIIPGPDGSVTTEPLDRGD
jgi:exodeoxyribonuclease VII small subunit